MKTTSTILLLSLSFCSCGPSKLGREQARIKTIVQSAYSSKDSQAFLDTFYWEGISDIEKQKTVRVVRRGIERGDRVIKIFFDSTDANTEFVDGGITYRANLPVVGAIQVVKYSESNPGHTATTSYSMGQKDGKLFIVGGANPVK